MVAVVIGPAAAEPKGQSCILPPLGKRWLGKHTAVAHQKKNANQVGGTNMAVALLKMSSSGC
ncbi:TPA: hypothetical protein ACH3X2_007063 [Trebouxia sp. C0005]